MWAQLIKMRTKPGRGSELMGLHAQLEAMEQPGSGLLRTTLMQDQKDTDVGYVIVMFESEEQARARESDPRREAGLAGVRATMGDLLEGPPEFVDLTVLKEISNQP
jgi:hypothetical protein